jgi:enoyl-CoA hydratase/carnithine racemase
LSLAQRDGVLRIEIDRPAVLNALDTATTQCLRDVLRAADHDDAVRSVLLTGAGRAFCAGADIGSEFSDHAARASIEKGMRESTGPMIMALRELRKPVVAAVNGAAAGVGCSVAIACDIVIASESAYFLLAFSRLGLTPDGGASLTIPARIGMGRALTLALLAERLPAAQALEYGLIDRVVPDRELAEVAEALALQLAQGPTLAYAASKEAINRSTLAGLADALDTEARLQGRLVTSSDFSEGAAAFSAKRPAHFLGK